MNTKIYSMIAAAALGLGLAGCNDKWEPKLQEEGHLSLASLGLDVTTAEDVISRAEGVDVAGFTVAIINSGEETVGQWIYSEMPEIVTLPVGEYTVRAYSHQVEKAAWDAPYYEGEQAFKIESNKIAEPQTVVCRFASVKVTVSFSDDLLKHLGADYKVTVIANDEGQLEYMPGETRSGYFEALPQSNTLVATFEGTVDGVAETIRKEYVDVAAGTHYQIKYSVKGGNPAIPDESGEIDGSGIEVDASATDVNEGGEIEIEEDVIDDPGKRPGEEPENPDEPDDPGTGDDIQFSSPTLDLAGVNDPSELDAAEVKIHSEKGFKHLYVKINSENAAFMASVGSMMPSEFDLATGKAPDGTDLTETLESLGFEVGPYPADKKDVEFVITQFLAPLSADAFSPGVHTFSLEVVDNENASKKVDLKFEKAS